MIAIDTNILVYAHRGDSPFHTVAYKRVENLADSRQPFAIPWPCIHEFLAIVTHPGIYKPPTPSEKAIDQIDFWLECPTLHLIGESSTYWPVISTLVKSAKILGSQIHDARIAAICIHHGISELWSADRDFSRYPGLKVINPLLD